MKLDIEFFYNINGIELNKIFKYIDEIKEKYPDATINIRISKEH